MDDRPEAGLRFPLLGARRVLRSPVRVRGIRGFGVVWVGGFVGVEA